MADEDASSGAGTGEPGQPAGTGSDPGAADTSADAAGAAAEDVTDAPAAAAEEAGSGDRQEGEPAASAPPAGCPPGAPRSASRDPRVFVLLRELSEVHLLLDNVSANPTTTVSELTSDEKLAEQKLDKDWIEKVCEISWPPGGSNEERAEDAALLIRAKDYLNRLSHPASGSTIAFTLLVTQADEPKVSWWRRLWDKVDDNPTPPPPTPTRSSLAETAYPDLVSKAAGFRRAMWWISVGLVLTLFVTCALSWYVAYGNAALAELSTARQSLTTAQDAVNAAENAEATQALEDGAGQNASQGQEADGSAATPPPNVVTEAAPREGFVSYCDRRPYLGPSQAQQSQLCAARGSAERYKMRVEERLARWLCSVPFTDCDNRDKIEDSPSRAAAFANIMGSAVLPFLYGLLGAGAAIIRSLSRKIRASLLSPRDLHLSIQQIALGAVVGACIGLFVAAPGADASGEGLLGPVALSASAISFVAGFGVEAVFQALEALITRIFNITPAPAGNRGDGMGNN